MNILSYYTSGANSFFGGIIYSGYLGYLIWMLPAIILSAIAQISVKSKFSKYSQIRNSKGITGAQAAYMLLQSKGINNVRIVPISGNLTDNFNPKNNTISLSESVYNSTSIAAVGVACHEAGHACQLAEGYAPNKFRSAMVPVCNIGSKISWILIVIGLLLCGTTNIFLILGIVFFSLSVLFTLITLPVEFNASSRALKIIKETGMLSETEYPGAKAVLTAAAMTYVAAACTALLQLLRLILIANSRRR